MLEGLNPCPVSQNLAFESATSKADRPEDDSASKVLEPSLTIRKRLTIRGSWQARRRITRELSARVDLYFAVTRVQPRPRSLALIAENRWIAAYGLQDHNAKQIANSCGDSPV